MKFSEKLVSRCEKKGWKQADLARATGVSKNTAGRWWNGEIKPFGDEALLIARHLGVSLDFLADDEMDEPPSSPTLTRDQTAVLDVFEALNLSRHEAIRRLSGQTAEGTEPSSAPSRSQTRPLSERQG